MEYMPKVLQAIAGEDFTLYLYFSDGSVRLYDAKPILERGGAQRRKQSAQWAVA